MRLDQLAEKWHDEAAEHALAGNPARAQHIEHMIGSVGRPDVRQAASEGNAAMTPARIGFTLTALALLATGLLLVTDHAVLGRTRGVLLRPVVGAVVGGAMSLLSYWCTPCDEQHGLGDHCAYWDDPPEPCEPLTGFRPSGEVTIHGLTMREMYDT